MKILRLIKMALLFLLVFALAEVQVHFNTFFNVLPYVLYGLCLIVLLGGFFWLVKIKGVKLFIVPVLMVMCLGCPAYAFDFSDLASNVDRLDDASNNSFIDTLEEANTAGRALCGHNADVSYDNATLTKAIQVLDFFNKHKTDGGFLGDDTPARCANEYVDLAKEIQQSRAAKCSPTYAVLKNLALKDKCWPCDVTATIISAIQKVSIQTYQKINEGAKVLLGGIYLMWLALTILVSFAKFGFEKFGEFFTKLLNQTIVVIIIALILHAPLVQFYKITISPFITYTAALSMKFSEISQERMGGGSSLFQKIIDTLGLAASSKCNYCNEMNKDVNKEVSTGQFMDSASINGILCTVCSTYRQAAPMISLGQVMICFGRTTPETLGQLPILSRISQFSTPNISVSVTGYILVAVFSIFTFLVGYFIMASVFKLGVVFVLLPLFLVAFAFKISRPYATKAWGLIVYAMTTILIVSIFATMMILGFSVLLPESSVNGFITFFFSNESMGMIDMFSGSSFLDKLKGASGAEEIINRISGSMVSQYTFIHVLTMTSFAYICISTLSSAAELAEQITSAWTINSNDGRVLGQALTQAFSSTSKAAKTALGAGAFMGGRALEHTTYDKNGQVVTNTKTTDELMKEASEASEKNKAGGNKNKEYVSHNSISNPMQAEGNKNDGNWREEGRVKINNS